MKFSQNILIKFNQKRNLEKLTKNYILLFFQLSRSSSSARRTLSIGALSCLPIMFFLLLIFVLVRSFRHPARCAAIRDGYSAVVASFWCCESGVVTTPPRVSPVLPFDHKIKATFQFLTVSVAFTFTVLLQSILQADSNSPQLEFDRLKNEKIVTFPA